MNQSDPRASASPLVSALAARIEPEMRKLDSERFLQVTGGPDLAFRHKLLFFSRTVHQPGWLLIARNGDWFGLHVPGDHSFGGPLMLGPVHEAMLEAGYELPVKAAPRAKMYYAQYHGPEAARVPWLAARTLELFGTTDAASVRLDFTPPLDAG